MIENKKYKQKVSIEEEESCLYKTRYYIDEFEYI